ncbi:hypothetical protein B0H17DRAFT_1192156 [Mycena rosella]|uniref:Uncharacterized protein n=1 Tax=Mycena rosella TaxID=1033263 RepID=A0AAD7GY97_MYCRO|nr:hypothetical protein B0H17DRAFT_1192156 [Mycena rosella]
MSSPRFATRILEQQPSNAEAKEMLGVIQLEMGEIEAARAAAIEILTIQLKGKERALDLPRDDEAELKSNIVRALVGQVEIWMDPSYDLWCAPSRKDVRDLLAFALQTDPGNAEALQALASVRMSQERPDEAKQCLEQAWSAWKDLDLDDPKLPPIPTRLALVKLFLELALFTPALLVLHGVMASDDQDVEAWYLEGWCFFLMSEQAQEKGGKLDDLTWQELATDARDCLATCEVLHTNEGHPDTPLLEHVKELVAKLDALGIQPSPVGDDDGDGQEDWEDVTAARMATGTWKWHNISPAKVYY